jgi:hypothetical protein
MVVLPNLEGETPPLRYEFAVYRRQLDGRKPTLKDLLMLELPLACSQDSNTNKGCTFAFPIAASGTFSNILSPGW